MTISVSGRIDSGNAARVEAEILSRLGDGAKDVVLDAEQLEYVSSAGLRVLLRLKKTFPDLRMVNVSSQIYEILEMTGFSEIIPTERALRFVSARGLEELGSGVHSIVYRLDDETILKVVKDMTLEAIRREMQVSKTALIHGIPTAISYDVVRSEEGYGEVYEMFHAGVLSKALTAEPERREDYLRRFVTMYRDIHSVDVSDSQLGSVRDRYLAAAEKLAAFASPEECAMARQMIEAIPERHTFLHGDFHMNNVMLQDGELLLIDVGEAGYGHPLFDFAQTAWAYIAATGSTPERCRQITGTSMELACYVRDHLLSEYCGQTGEALERKKTVVHAMAMLRMILIRFLQGVTDQPDYPKRLERARRELFPVIPEVCELIKREFPE